MEFLSLENIYSDIGKFLRLLRFADIADIFIVAVAVYYFIMMIRGTRAVQLVKGIFVVVAVYMLSSVLALHTLN